MHPQTAFVVYHTLVYILTIHLYYATCNSFLLAVDI